MKNDYLKWAALIAALVATASAEYELARQVGFNQWVAAAVPGALDIYTVRALRAHRDVLAAVAAMIGVNAASHLVTAGLLPVNVPLVVAVSAIAPLVLWRVHRLADEAIKLDVIQLESSTAVEAFSSESLPTVARESDSPAKGPQVVSTPAGSQQDPAKGLSTVEISAVPEVYPAIETAVPAVPKAYPAVTESEETPADLREFPEAAVLAAEETRTRPEVHAEYVPEPVPDWTVPGDYADENGQPAEPEEEVEYPDPLIPKVRADFPDEVPGVRRLKETYSIGQPRAQRIRDELAGVSS